MNVTKTFKVTKCGECPNFCYSMDGPYCEILSIREGLDNAFVYPEGRNKIPPQCPCNI